MGYLTPDTIPDNTVCYSIRIPNDYLLVAAFMGAISELFKPENWEVFGELSPDETAAAWLPIYETVAENRGFCMLGSIVAFATSSMPSGVLLCDGQTYNRTDYPALYAILAGTFINDADTFHVPDLRQQFVRGETLANIGSAGGADNVNLSLSNLPTHDHLYAYHTPIPVTIGAGAPVVVYAPPDIPTLTSPTGAGTAFDNRPAYYSLAYGIIAV